MLQHDIKGVLELLLHKEGNVLALQHVLLSWMHYCVTVQKTLGVLQMLFHRKSSLLVLDYIALTCSY